MRDADAGAKWSHRPGRLSTGSIACLSRSARDCLETSMRRCLVTVGPIQIHWESVCYQTVWVSSPTMIAGRPRVHLYVSFQARVNACHALSAQYRVYLTLHYERIVGGREDIGQPHSSVDLMNARDIAKPEQRVNA